MSRRGTKKVRKDSHYYRRMKLRLAEQFGAKCTRCKKEDDPLNLTIEHIQKLRDGGSNKIENLTLFCYSCNQATQ